MVVDYCSWRDNILDDWMNVVEENVDAAVAHEVDQYLLDLLEMASKDKFDIYFIVVEA